MLSARDDSLQAALLPWLVVLFALGAWLGRVDLLTPDEARHAEIAREMFLEGNWLAPRIYGEPYYDKPALFYWLTGSSLWLFGPSAWAARLPSVAGALFSIVMTSWWVRSAWGTSMRRRDRRRVPSGLPIRMPLRSPIALVCGIPRSGP